IDEVDRRFLDSLNDADGTGATLVDESLAALATYDARAVGSTMSDMSDPAVRQVVERLTHRGEPDSFVLERPLSVGQVEFKPSVVAYEPVRFADKQWNLFVASSLGEVDQVVADVFRRTAVWAGVIAVALTATLGSTAVSTVRNRARLERERHALLTRELDQARQIQLRWLPEQHDDRPEIVCRRGTGLAVDIAAVNVPASHVSGDFYNWFELPDGRSVVTIGDVTGHGTSAALLMATAQLLVRTTMERTGGDPGQCLTEVNRQLCTQVFSGQFITMVCLVLDLEQGLMNVTSAGHPPPLVRDGPQFRELGVRPQLVLGVEPDVTFDAQRFALPPRAELVLYTDGAVEAASPTGERYSMEQLRAALGGSGAFGSARALLDAAVRAVNDFRGPQPLADDLTVVAVQLQEAPVTASRPTAAAP
ncbi:MAG TPA: PP2C family protein-serine/threonine phosphatase, partial [Tepidisphaeraceae bacterium]|nr:PP2C family protein-serine/threonine phosphatase [Tepidisphaeraceae bacterium]